MSRHYYYFAASLPLISLEGKPPLTMDAFLEDCERLLSPDDLSKVRKALSKTPNDNSSDTSVYGRWTLFNHALRNELAFARAQKFGKDPSGHIRGERHPSAFISDVVAQAFKAPDPLAAEKALDQAKWQYLEEMGAGHFLDFDFIIIYALKLNILERYQSIQSSVGWERFEEYKKFEITQETFI